VNDGITSEKQYCKLYYLTFHYITLQCTTYDCTFITFTALIAGVINNQDYVLGGCYRLTNIYNVYIYYAVSLSSTMSVINKCRKLTDRQCYPKRNPSGNKSWKKRQIPERNRVSQNESRNIAIGINTK